MKIPILLPDEREPAAPGVYSAILCCNVVRVTCTRRAIHFYFPDGDCCDMSGAIRLARLLDPKVRRILTYSGKRCDTAYLWKNKDWRSIRISR